MERSSLSYDWNMVNLGNGTQISWWYWLRGSLGESFWVHSRGHWPIWGPQDQSCKNVPTVPTSWCYFFWPVQIFGKSTQKTGENTRKQAKTRDNRRKTGAFLVLIFLWEKLVGANFYAFCNYEASTLLPSTQHNFDLCVQVKRHK